MSRKRIVLGAGRLSAWSTPDRWAPTSVAVSGGLKFSKLLIGRDVILVAEVLPKRNGKRSRRPA